MKKQNIQKNKDRIKFKELVKRKNLEKSIVENTVGKYKYSHFKNDDNLSRHTRERDLRKDTIESVDFTKKLPF